MRIWKAFCHFLKRLGLISSQSQTESPSLSEYERLIGKLRQTLREAPPADLTDNQIAALARETGLGRHQIENLRQSARVVRKTQIPAEIFYVFVREDRAFDLARLLKLEIAELEAAITRAVRANVIPVHFKDALGSVAERLEEIRLENGLLVRRSAFARLIDEVNDKPLPGLFVQVIDPVAQPKPREIAADMTDEEGLFSFTYITQPEASGKQQFELSIHDQSKKLSGVHLEIEIGSNEPYPVKISLPVSLSDSPLITELTRELALPLKPDLESILKEHKIFTLSDVLAKGGLSRLPELEALRDDDVVKHLDQHATLNLLPSDLTINAKLIEKGYGSLHAIGRSNLKGIEAAVGDRLKAAQIYHAAKNQTRYLDNLITEHRVLKANGQTSPLAQVFADTQFSQECQCKDCQAAVSPLAYLADLLDYAVGHIRNNSELISLDFLSETFHQAFGELPASCASSEERIRQVRIAVEVLRSTFRFNLDAGFGGPNPSQLVTQAIDDYVLEAYKALLPQFGTSYDELRLARIATTDKREELRARLAIRRAGAAGDELAELLLTQAELTERNLERLFGLHDTLPAHRLSRRAKFDDPLNQLRQWRFENVAWGRTTDSDGRIYLVMWPNFDGDLDVVVVKGDGEMIALGLVHGTSGRAVLSEQEMSGVSGEVEVNFGQPTVPIVITIAAVPEFLSWRLNYLRTQWLKQDWSSDPYANASLPSVDPDTIGPDDLRRPSATNEAFALWLKRRIWIDARLAELRSSTRTIRGQTPLDLEKIRDVMVGPLTYEGANVVPWPDAPTLQQLTNLLAKLVAGTEVEESTEEVNAKLNLTVESFGRLMEVKAKADAWENAGGSKAVTVDEWEEVVSILVQAQKRAFLANWRAEEDAIADLLSPRFFWISINEPAEGVWPEQRPAGKPWIDPDAISEKDLPDSIVGDPARKLLNDRRSELETIQKEIQAARESTGFEAMATLALGNPPEIGDPPAPTNWFAEIVRIKSELVSTDQATAAQTHVENDLHLSEIDFNFLAQVAAQDFEGQTDPAKRPTVNEWNKLFPLLTRAKKIRDSFPKWITDEDDLGLSYWNFCKARLPRWRASAGERAAWQQALRARYRTPIVDPDLVQLDHLIAPQTGDPAYDLWRNRSGELLAKLNDYQQAMLAPILGPPVIRMNLLLRGTLGVSSLGSLRRSLDKGELSSVRLEQLNVTRAELTEAFRIRELTRTSASLSQKEWNIFYDILLQIHKRRLLYTKWRREEQAAGLTLGPDFFQLPEPLPSIIPPEATPPIHPWRTNPADRRDWEATLKSRVDQEKSLIAAHWSAISAVEEATLPKLRNDFIKIVANSTDLAIAAKEVGDTFLLDMTAGGCQITTRAAQAIETIQVLIWSLRTGQLNDTYPNLELEADDFDEEWKWLGSYATWRAAMMVFLYPENILLPSLRRRQTPAFQQLASRLRESPRLTPQVACQAADDYASYFRDVCSLTIEATCEAKTWIPDSSGCGERQSDTEAGYRDLVYMFARSSVNNKVYWSTYDLDGEGDYRQTYWEAVPGLEKFKAVRTIGAASFKVKDGSRYVYVFVEGRDPSSQLRKIGYLRYNLEQGTQRWSEETQELSISLISEGINILQGIVTEAIPLLLRQTASEEVPLMFAFQVKFVNSSRSFVIGNQLNEAGDGWAYERWREWFWLRYRNLRVNLICCMALDKDWHGFFFQDSTTKEISFHSESGELVEFDRDSELEEPEGGFRRVAGSATWKGALLQRNARRVHAFLNVSGSEEYLTIDAFDQPFIDERSLTQALIASGSIPPHSGQLSDSYLNLAIQRSDLTRPATGTTDITRYGQFLARLNEEDGWFWKESSVRVAPRAPVNLEEVPVSLDDATHLGPLVSNEALAERRNYEGITYGHSYLRDTAFPNNCASRQNLIYLEEAYYFLPILIALSLGKNKEYEAALDWFRNVYNYSAPQAWRKIYIGLIVQASLRDDLVRLQGWLSDPINPHEIAATRRNTYTRFTILSLIRCLLDYADTQFTQDTVESNAQARALYLTALELLNEPELKQSLNGCDQIIGELTIQIEPEAQLQVARSTRELRQLDTDTLRRTINKLKTVLAASKPVEARLREMRSIIAGAMRSRKGSAATLGDIGKRRLEMGAQSADKVLTQLSIAANARQIGKAVADTPSLRQENKPTDNLPRVSGSSAFLTSHTAHANTRTELRSGTRSSRMGSRARTLDLIPSYHFCVPPNPLVSTMRLRAELNLYKLRTCRNIAGLERQLEPYAAATDTTTGLPSIGDGGQLVLPGAVRIQPTQYRYRFLIERAKQLASVAQQMETTFMSLLEKLDAEDYNLLKARQDARTTRASVRLQDLRVREADDGVELANRQRQASVIQDEHFSGLISEGPLDEEDWAIGLLWGAMALQFGVATIRAGAILLAGAGVDTGAAGTTFGTGTIGAAVASAATDQTVLQSLTGGLSSWSAALSMIASQKRREEEWQLQQELAEQNVLIGDQQILLANDRVRIVGQERQISSMQADNADEIVEFLNTKFANRDLYDWMSGILENVYRYFLQQTTAVARLAENQLAFERQQVPPAFIQGDYWIPRGEGVVNVNPNGNEADRRGLTGSASLLQDIYRLDQFAFETDRRKLQLTKTISLARLDPIALQRFRQTGVMIFASPMTIFDRDFPGHYLRLIKRVRTSVIALIPPTEGIKATLTTLGISRVVVGGDLFQTTVVNRGPESVALTSPINATGLFELEAQGSSELLLPFEGLGVDTSWEFRLPKAANYFDYNTIADVLLTIEYTALDSFMYRQQVIQQLDRTVSAERPFSFRHQFPDQWYDFHNSDLVTLPQRSMVARFRTRREDFPPNVDELTIQHVTLYFTFKDGADKTIEVSNLSFTKAGGDAVGGSANSTDGFISTRQANGASWVAISGTPIGEWELALPNTQEMKDKFKNGDIEEILFVITYAGITPAWPNS